MKHIADLLAAVSERLRSLAKNNAVVARKISVGDRHVVPLCELALGFGGAGGQGEATEGEGAGQGTGGGAGGGAKAAPVAVIIVDGDQVRVESLGH